jgi:hypothetical protein
MLKKISALSSVKELSKKEQHAINGGAGWQCTSTVMPGVYDSEEDISGDYGNGHVITCYATRAQTAGQSRTH